MTQVDINIYNVMNLENGNIYNSLDNNIDNVNIDWHILVAYNATRNVHTVIFHNIKLCEISILTELFDDVDLNIASNASFQSELLDIAFETDKTIIIKKDSKYWKLCSIFEDNTKSTIKYSIL